MWLCSDGDMSLVVDATDPQNKFIVPICTLLFNAFKASARQYTYIHTTYKTTLRVIRRLCREKAGRDPLLSHFR